MAAVRVCDSHCCRTAVDRLLERAPVCRWACLCQNLGSPDGHVDGHTHHRTGLHRNARRLATAADAAVAAAAAIKAVAVATRLASLVATSTSVAVATAATAATAANITATNTATHVLWMVFRAHHYLGGEMWVSEVRRLRRMPDGAASASTPATATFSAATRTSTERTAAFTTFAMAATVSAAAIATIACSASSTAAALLPPTRALQLSSEATATALAATTVHTAHLSARGIASAAARPLSHFARFAAAIECAARAACTPSLAACATRRDANSSHWQWHLGRRRRRGRAPDPNIGSRRRCGLPGAPSCADGNCCGCAVDAQVAELRTDGASRRAEWYGG